MKLLFLVVCLVGLTVAAPATKVKRDILPGDPRYGTDYHHHHHHAHGGNIQVTKSVGGYAGTLTAYGPPNHTPGHPIGNHEVHQETHHQYETAQPELSVPHAEVHQQTNNAYLAPHVEANRPVNPHVPEIIPAQVYQPTPPPDYLDPIIVKLRPTPSPVTSYGTPVVPEQTYVTPATHTQTYQAPAADTYQAPAAETYEAPQAPSQTYQQNAPVIPSTSYGVPFQTYGVPETHHAVAKTQEPVLDENHEASTAAPISAGFPSFGQSVSQIIENFPKPTFPSFQAPDLSNFAQSLPNFSNIGSSFQAPQIFQDTADTVSQGYQNFVSNVNTAVQQFAPTKTVQHHHVQAQSGLYQAPVTESTFVANHYHQAPTAGYPAAHVNEAEPTQLIGQNGGYVY